MEDLAAGPAKKVKDILFKTDAMLTPEFTMVANLLDFRFRGKSLEDEERKVFKDVKLTLFFYPGSWVGYDVVWVPNMGSLEGTMVSLCFFLLF